MDSYTVGGLFVGTVVQKVLCKVCLGVVGLRFKGLSQSFGEHLGDLFLLEVRDVWVVLAQERFEGV